MLNRHSYFPLWRFRGAVRRAERGRARASARATARPGGRPEGRPADGRRAHSLKTHEIAHLYERYAIPVYNRNGIAVARAFGSLVWDQEGRRYLDFFPGWGTNSLGHCHPRVVRAIRTQAERLIHVPNTFYHEPHARFAQALVESSIDGKVFFTNSGAEAVEAAIKLARKFGSPKRWEIITTENSFHGRTLGALAATGQSKYQKGFEPALPGFRHVPFNSIAAVKKALRPRTVAVMLEPIQGEGGIHIASPQYLRQLRRLCDEKNLLLIFDEISTGMGRTGTLFCFQQYRVIPDILLLGKGIAGGAPLGVLVAGRHISDTWEKSTHATTFGGNPLMTAAGLAALEAIRKEKLLSNVRKQGRYLLTKLEQQRRRNRIIRQVRGRGLMIGIELDRPGAPFVKAAAQKGLLINCTQEKILRLYPAFTVTKRQCDQALKILEKALAAK
ncbi:MAG: aspartate aminotransferase family protein [Candidatus Omnitrophica bacterium]|nr:aspartate aminotransferase family protein [Candidatus Omnitrophota bacterium]